MVVTAADACGARRFAGGGRARVRGLRAGAGARAPNANGRPDRRVDLELAERTGLRTDQARRLGTTLKSRARHRQQRGPAPWLDVGKALNMIADSRETPSVAVSHRQ
jgi:hypothetical protein